MSNNHGSAPQVAFITGASSGFGAGLARRLSHEGFAVGLAARRRGLLEALAEEITAAGGRATAFPCDVAEREDLLAAVRRCEGELGPVDLLVANAGVSTHATPEELDAREVQRVFGINFFGAVTATEAVLPGMLERENGQIVVVSSLASFQGLPFHGSYCGSKAAMNQYFEALRLDLAPRGVHVTVIAPGFVKTPMTAHNRYPMPFLMELEPALDIMMRGILKRKKLVRFPAPLSTATWWGQILSRSLFDRLVLRFPGRSGGGFVKEREGESDNEA
jgi:short-subunit dehydrogenase